MAQLIFLHGASSSGKSTLARALQARLPTPFLHLSIDHLRDSGALPLQRYANGEFDWAESREAFFAGFRAAVAAFADAGNDMVLEHILEREQWLDDLRRKLASHDVFFVALHCPPELLAQRESQRGDRPAGSALRDFQTIHKDRRYDLELDSRDGVDANCETLLAAWRSGVRRSDFT